MRKVLRSAAIVTASLLIPIVSLIFYVQLLMPEGNFYWTTPQTYFSASVNSSLNKPITDKFNTLQERFLGIFPAKTTSSQIKQRRYVIPGGQVLGFKLYTKGVVIVAVDGVAGINGKENPAQEADLRQGDLVLEIDGVSIDRNNQVSDAIAASGGNSLKILIEREGEERIMTLTPVKTRDNLYKAGIWVRDSSAGIGTITYTDPKTNMLAGLGHAISDVDTGAVIPISSGEAVPATVKGCYKSTGGKPGELCGVFNGSAFASLLENGETGVYGKLHRDPSDEPLKLPVAMRNEVKVGKAKIIATVDDGIARCYDAEIRKVYPVSGGSKKNLIVQVTDPELIAITGGIVQGMSGSPILQNGMLVGAVTHVFVNNPLQGYGIFAETMLETSDMLAAQPIASDFLEPAA